MVGQDVRRIALVTLASVPNDIEANARRMKAYMVQAADDGAGLALFPELALTGNVPGAAQHAITADAPVLQRLAKAAEECGLAASLGFWEQANGCKHVAQAFLHEGTIKCVYRKIFCCEADGAHGQEFVTVDWDGVRVGTLICWDLHFPVVTRGMVRRGARLILHPCAYHDDLTTPFDSENHNVYLPRARAKENGVFFVHLNASGRVNDTRAFFGNAIVVDPDGQTVTRVDRAPFSENFLLVDLDLAKTESCQSRPWVKVEEDRPEIVVESVR